MKTTLSVLAAGVCALLLPFCVNAATAPAANKAQQKHTATASAWPPETLSGKITIVDPARKLLVIEGLNGVPFDLYLSDGARIMDGSRKIGVKDLSQELNKQASVKFVPESRGDIASSVTVGS